MNQPRHRLRHVPGALLLALLAFALGQHPAAAFESTARAAILIDTRADQVLYARNADEPLPPASMSKLMTALMVFERLRAGSLSLDDAFPVSEKAWRKGGSKMFVEVGSRVRVEDLLRGIIVQSGNDACIVVAEALAGTEERFAELMTERGRELGLTASVFKNSSGWPDEGHVMSAADLARLAHLIVEEYPEYYHYYSELEFTYGGIRQQSRNPLLRSGIAGVDGLKTGHTTEAGYGLVASAIRDGRRLVLVIAGLESANARAREAERLLEHGFRDFQSYRLFSRGETVDSADVWLGSAGRVALVPAEDVYVTLSREARSGLSVKLVYAGPVPAPIAQGAEIASLVIAAPGMPTRTIPLQAAEAVEAAGLFGRVTSALGYLIWGPS
jgi:serine-type D-Ala-D-Ala carboxypeptidase (penicillin-binding protein 5/6)